jgi:hypothetical protein
MPGRVDCSAGFAILAGWCCNLGGDLARSLDPARRSRAGARHLMSDPMVRDAAHDSRLVEAAASILGSDPFPFRATLFDKGTQANWLVPWHQDTALPVKERRDVPGWGPWSCKEGVVYAHAPAEALSRIVAIRLHLDDSSGDNGPLRVLPGTHELGVLRDEDILALAAAREKVECLGSSGTVVVMRPLIVHGSSRVRNGVRRRVLHIEYAESPRFDGGLRLAVC